MELAKDIVKDYGNQLHRNGVQAGKIERLQAENKKLIRQVSDLRKARIRDWEGEHDAEQWQSGLRWGMIIGVTMTIAIFTIAAQVAQLI